MSAAGSLSYALAAGVLLPSRYYIKKQCGGADVPAGLQPY